MDPTAGQSSAIDRIFTRTSISTKNIFKNLQNLMVSMYEDFTIISYNDILNILN